MRASPHFVPGLSATVDVWRIYLDNVITTVGAQSVLNMCFAGQAVYCSMITRNQSTNPALAGQPSLFILPTANLGRFDVKGVDFSANYKLPQFSFGQFNIDWQTSYTSKYDVLADNDPATQWQGNVGYPGLFRIRSNFGVGWELGDYSVAYMGRYYSGMKEACASAPRPCNSAQVIGRTTNLMARPVRG